jgi:hypothetical protein
LFRVESVRSDLAVLRARTSLAVAQVSSARRDELLRETMRWVSVARATPSTRAQAAFVEAGVIALRTSKHDRRVVQQLTDVCAAFDALGMAFFAAVARRALGEAMGGDTGKALIANADAFLRAQEIRVPRRWLAAFGPGFAISD